MPAQDAAPVTGVFPADDKLHLLEIGIQAIQLSPYHAGPAAPRPIRLGTAAAFLACYCPLHLSDPGKPSDPGTSLRVPPGCAGDTAKRLVAHASSYEVTPSWSRWCPGTAGESFAGQHGCGSRIWGQAAPGSLSVTRRGPAGEGRPRGRGN